MKVVSMHYWRAERELGDIVRDLVRVHGVPTNPDDAAALAAHLIEPMTHLRSELAARESEAIAAEFRDFGIARRRHYPIAATEGLVMTTSGLAPDAPPRSFEIMDPENGADKTVRIHPFTMPHNEDVRERFISELAAGAGRHVKSASRDLVIDTANLNGAGWARQLTGAESCRFCALLVSRGAVYTKESADFRTHNHCDCTATLVRRVGDPYEGKDKAVALNEMYRAARGDMKKFGQLIKEEGGGYEALAA